MLLTRASEDFRTDFRRQVVRVMRISLVQLRATACDRRIILNLRPPSVVNRMDYRDARRRNPETVCADLVADLRHSITHCL